MDLLSVISTVITMSLIMLVGYFAKAVNIISANAVRGLVRLLSYITEPLLIIYAFQYSRTEETLLQFLSILGISVVMHIFFILISILFYKKDKSNQGPTFRFALIFGDFMYIGLPVLRVCFNSDEALFYCAAFSIVYNVLIRTYGIYLTSEKPSFRKMFAFSVDPREIATIVGIILFLLNIKLPSFLSDFCSTLGNMSFPIALLVLGAYMTNYKFKDVFSASTYTFAIVKLIIFPLITMVVCAIFKIDKGNTNMFVVMACVASSFEGLAFGKRFPNANQKLMNYCVSITSVFSMISIPLMVAVSNLIFSLI